MFLQGSVHNKSDMLSHAKKISGSNLWRNNRVIAKHIVSLKKSDCVGVEKRLKEKPYFFGFSFYTFLEFLFVSWKFIERVTA